MQGGLSMRQWLTCVALLSLAVPGLAQQEASGPSKETPSVLAQQDAGGPARETPPLAAAAQKAQVESAKPAHPITFGAETDATSRYVWRGLALSEKAVQQSQLWAATRGLTFTVWSNFVTANGPHKGKFNEVDYTLDYSKEMKGWTFEPYVNLYTY